MTTLYITRGLPGSGKTTMAENWVKDDPAGDPAGAMQIAIAPCPAGISATFTARGYTR